jgi:hypothetical protein
MAQFCAKQPAPVVNHCSVRLDIISPTAIAVELKEPDVILF